MQQAEDKPPYIQFETRSEEDRDSSIVAGHFVGRDVDFVIVTQRGSRDRIERKWTEWLKVKEQETSEDRFNPMWLDQYKAQYRRWKEGQDDPLTGIPIKSWPVLSPSQTRLLIELSILTVEDLADANEETVTKIGMGARALKEKAKSYLEAAKGPGALAERMTKMEESLAGLQVRNESLETQNADLSRQLEVYQAKERQANSVPA